MPKTRISDEEFEQLEATKRHEEVVDAIKSIAAHDHTGKLEEAITRQAQHLSQLMQRDPSGALVAELKPLIAELAACVKDLKGALAQPPAPITLKVIRGSSTGLIERLVVERVRGN